MGWFLRWTPAQPGEEQPVGLEHGVERNKDHETCLSQPNGHRKMWNFFALGGGTPAHQATWEAFMVLLAIRHSGEESLVGDALGVWFGMVRFNAKAKQNNEIAKDVAMHLAPWAIWSEANTLADSLSRVALGKARHDVLARRDAAIWTFLQNSKNSL